jgi:predicted ATPase/DNA-binding CsgD family transcriptional regulator/Flp pilus assembly protein TadD
MSPAAAVTLRQRTGQLPVEVNSFVGRRGELAEIRRLLGISPLVTLVGPGGVGKTRLVRRAASGLERTFHDGVRYVELGDLRSPDLLLPTVAEALGIHEQSSTLTLQTLIDKLIRSRTLLVLDNCEHLLDEAARLVDSFLRGCPELRVLATSREPLGIPGESKLLVPPLTVPDLAFEHLTAPSLQQFEAVNLFTDRAVSALPGFELTHENSEDIARTCQRLDGIPLALELAAARLRTLSPRQLADRLGDRYELLTGGSRVAPERHQTLRLCVDWSYDQCSEKERLLWSRLSVFVGGFELDAVEGTCAFGTLPQVELLNLLSSLVDKSIVIRDGSHNKASFRMLETLREYGRERLIETDELGDMRRRHLDWYAGMLAQVKADLISPRQLTWAGRLDQELPNIRAALDHSLSEEGSALSGLRMTTALNLYWISRGLLSEGRYWLGRATNAEIPPDDSHVEALYSVGALAGLQGDLPAAAEATTRCHQMARILGTPAANAYAANVSGMLALTTGDLPAAISHMERAAEAHHLTGDLIGEIEMRVAHGLACAMLGDAAGAVESHKQVLALTQPRGETWYQAYSLWAYGLAMWRVGEFATAKSLLEQSLSLRRVMSDLLGSVWCLEALAFVAVAEQDAQRAAVLFGASAALSHDAGTPTGTFPDLASAYADSRRIVERALGSREFDKAFAQGGGYTYDEAVAFALGTQTSKRPTDNSRDKSLLTPRQNEVAELVASGLTNKGIADRLVISERTAQGHVEAILVKLGFTTRSQIAAWLANDK